MFKVFSNININTKNEIYYHMWDKACVKFNKKLIISYITVKFYYEKYIIHKSDKRDKLLGTKMLNYTYITQYTYYYIVHKIHYFDMSRLTTNIIYENII